MGLLQHIEAVLRVSQAARDQPAKVPGVAIHQITEGIGVTLNSEIDQARVRQAAVQDMSPFDG